MVASPVPGRLLGSRRFSFALPAPQRVRGPAGTAIVGLAFAGNGAASGSAAEAIGFPVAEVAGGGGDPDDHLLGGDCDRTAGGGNVAALPGARNRLLATGVQCAVTPGPAGMRRGNLLPAPGRAMAGGTRLNARGCNCGAPREAGTHRGII